MTGPVIRAARDTDLPTILALLADDPLGSAREDLSQPLADDYRRAFEAIAADPAQELVVAVLDGVVVGTLQLSFLPGLAHRGGLRGQVEDVRVARSRRGAGIGATMMDWAIDRCRARGCRIVQLTSSATRTDAHRFYTRLGFAQSHVGFKLSL